MIEWRNFSISRSRRLFPRPVGAAADYDLIPQIVVLLLEAMAFEGMTPNSKVDEENSDRAQDFQAVSRELSPVTTKLYLNRNAFGCEKLLLN